MDAASGYCCRERAATSVLRRDRLRWVGHGGADERPWAEISARPGSARCSVIKGATARKCPPAPLLQEIVRLSKTIFSALPAKEKCLFFLRVGITRSFGNLFNALRVGLGGGFSNKI